MKANFGPNLPNVSDVGYTCGMDITQSTGSAQPPIPVTLPREHIVSTPEVCGGKPRINGTRITVENIVVWYERMGMSADEIVAGYPQRSLADIHAAFAYYHDHREEIDARMAAGERFVAEIAGIAERG